LSAFFFETRGAKKKAWQKRTRRKGGFAVRGDQRSARWISGRFLKKATEKLSNRQRLTDR
jgi:hypothetical protein